MKKRSTTLARRYAVRSPATIKTTLKRKLRRRQRQDLRQGNEDTCAKPFEFCMAWYIG